MAYTAIEKMRKNNIERFGRETGPISPAEHYTGEECSLKGLALRFLHTRCEDLKFDPEREEEEEKTGLLQGDSFLPGQIPYNMQMDINRLCLERELEKFIDSGVAEDAYNIYYCFLETFFGHYGKTKKMVELLSEFESNGSSLLMKHRDHYSHSVYVFALGLAIFEASPLYREAFRSFYGYPEASEGSGDDHRLAHAFLEYWGMTALFHDIGYPFELPFEQVLAYGEVQHHERGPGSTFMAYRDISRLTGLSEEEKNHFEKLYGKAFETTNDLFAHAIYERIGREYSIDEAEFAKTIASKPVYPERFNYFMDHAWFSSARLYRQMVLSFGISSISRMHVDVLTSILLHNSLFKFSVAFYKSGKDAKPPLKAGSHPLAWMLMLCDELQCWDRTAYGRNSRRELHPMDAEFDITKAGMKATYYYDIEEKDKIDAWKQAYNIWKEEGRPGRAPRLKAYSDMAEDDQSFRTDIEKIVDTGEFPLTIRTSVKKLDRQVKHTYLSNSNFLHLYDFAVTLNARYNYQGREQEIEADQLVEEFDRLSLEYQLSNINQAKSFSRYLDAIGCFFTDRPVDYDMVRAFNREQTDIIGAMEHERWVREHVDQGWISGDLYEKADMPAETSALSREDEKALRKAWREQLRMHKLAMDGDPASEEIRDHYDLLPEEDKGKDYEPFNSMLKLVRKFDGLRIYQL